MGNLKNKRGNYKPKQKHINKLNVYLKKVENERLGIRNVKQ
jgi:hypothetical protein